MRSPAVPPASSCASVRAVSLCPDVCGKAIRRSLHTHSLSRAPARLHRVPGFALVRVAVLAFAGQPYVAAPPPLEHSSVGWWLTRGWRGREIARPSRSALCAMPTGSSRTSKRVVATREIWDEWRLTAERFVLAGDQVVVLVRVIAEGHLSGVRLERETAHIWDIADNRVTRCEVFLDRSEALRTVEAAS